MQALARGFLSRQKTHALTTAELVFINMVPPAPTTTIDPQSRCETLLHPQGRSLAASLASARHHHPSSTARRPQCCDVYDAS